MKSKPAPRKPRGVVARFMAGYSIYEVSMAHGDTSNARVEAILRRALRKGMKP